MGVGDPALPVASDASINQPVPESGEDAQRQVNARLKVLERTSNKALVEQLRYIYDVLGEPYPPF